MWTAVDSPTSHVADTVYTTLSRSGMANMGRGAEFSTTPSNPSADRPSHALL
jgi:hypothetical protein